MSLRFIMRDGKRILQQEVDAYKKGPTPCSDNVSLGREWQDVPLVEEPKKAREWNVYLYADGGISSGYKRPNEKPEFIHVREVLEGE